MPIYEYRCQGCGRKASLFFRSISAVEDNPACPTCGQHQLTRLMSRVWLRSAQSGEMDPPYEEDGIPFYGPDPFSGEDLYGADLMTEGSDDGDIAEVAREARFMAQAMGEPLDAGFDAALRHVEQGADPDDVFGELDASERSLDESGPDNED